MFFIKQLNIDKYEHKIIVSICVTMTISSIFMILFNNGFKKGCSFQDGLTS